MNNLFILKKEVRQWQLAEAITRQTQPIQSSSLQFVVNSQLFITKTSLILSIKSLLRYFPVGRKIIGAHSLNIPSQFTWYYNLFVQKFILVSDALPLFRDKRYESGDEYRPFVLKSINFFIVIFPTTLTGVMEIYEKYLHVDYFSGLRVHWYATGRCLLPSHR